MRTLFHWYRAWLACCVGYLIGSILTADIAARVAGRTGERVDLRSVGSGNPGGANAVVNIGKGWGAAVIAGDIAKGVAATAAGGAIAGPAGAYGASIGAVAGHCFPAWSNFRGGKGLGTTAGTTLALFPAWLPVDLALIGGVYKATKSLPVATYVACAAFVAGAMLWWRRGWRNLWGPPASAALPLYAVLSVAMICYRFLAAPEHMGDRER